MSKTSANPFRIYVSTRGRGRDGGRDGMGGEEGRKRRTKGRRECKGSKERRKLPGKCILSLSKGRSSHRYKASPPGQLQEVHRRR